MLKGKTAIVTGAAKGIGKAIAIAFAKEGCNIVLNYHSNVSDETIEEIEDCGVKCMPVQGDVSDFDFAKNFIKDVKKEFGTIDVLVNNAGKCNDNYVQFMSLKQWNDVVSTNLTGAYICSRIFSKNMIANRNGKIINISSLKGQVGSEGQCNYSASKAGVIGLTKSLAKEMGKFGVSVNAICPGFIVTDLNRYNKNKAEIAERMSILKEQRSLEDFLNFVTMLCSDYLVGISGQVFNLDSRIN